MNKADSAIIVYNGWVRLVMTELKWLYAYLKWFTMI